MKTVNIFKKFFVILIIALVTLQSVAYAQVRSKEVFTSKITYTIEFSAKEALAAATPVNIDFSEGQILDESSISLTSSQGESIKTPEIVLGNDGSSFVFILEPSFTQGKLVFSTTAVQNANETVTVRTDTNIISHTITISREILNEVKNSPSPSPSPSATRQAGVSKTIVPQSAPTAQPTQRAQTPQVTQNTQATAQATNAPAEEQSTQTPQTETLQENQDAANQGAEPVENIQTVFVDPSQEQIVVDTINYMDKEQAMRKNMYLALVICAVIAVIVLVAVLIKRKKASANKSLSESLNENADTQKEKQAENTTEEISTQVPKLSRAALREQKEKQKSIETAVKQEAKIHKNEDASKQPVKEKVQAINQTDVKEAVLRSSRSTRSAKNVQEQTLPQEMEVYKTPQTYKVIDEEKTKEFIKKISEINVSLSNEELKELGEKIQKNSAEYLEMERKNLAVAFTKKRFISDKEYDWIMLCIKEVFAPDAKDSKTENTRTSRSKK